MSLHRRVEARNRGLERVSRLTSLTLSGGLVLSGGFAAVAAHASSGHGRRAVQTRSGTSPVSPSASAATGRSLLAPATTPPTAPADPSQTVPQSAPLPTTSITPLTAPQTVPQYVPAPQPPDPVVSGGS